MRIGRPPYWLLPIAFALMILIIAGVLYGTHVIRVFSATGVLLIPIIFVLCALPLLMLIRRKRPASGWRATHRTDIPGGTSGERRAVLKPSPLLNVLSWIPAAFGYVLFIGIFISPRFEQYLDALLENQDQIWATVHACEPLRDGREREHTVVCTFTYTYKGETYTATSKSWSTQSPFVTPASLDRVLAEQSAQVFRAARVDPDYPKNASLADDRWLDAPGLWLWAAFSVLGLFGLSLLIPTGYKRADMAYDALSGEFAQVNNKRQSRLRVRAALQNCAIVIAMFGGVYALSNRVHNLASLIGMSGLQTVPATLTDCEHRYHGMSKGHDQIDCKFRYRFEGQSFQGQAESLDFRLFPTHARMDAVVEQLNRQESGIVAHVDPRHPGYAIAFISNAWWVPYSYGIFELMLWVVWLPVGLFFLAKNWGVMRQKNSAI